MTANSGEDVEKLNDSYIAGRDAKWYSYSGKQFGRCYKTKHVTTIRPIHS